MRFQDIGTHFPDTDAKFKDISSMVLLEKALELITKEGYDVNNIDSNVIAQAPKMMPYIPQMRVKLAQVFENRRKSIVNQSEKPTRKWMR